jgi:hypothetical protein
VDTNQIGLHLQRAVEHAPGENDKRVFAAIQRSEKLVIGWGDGNTHAPNASARRAGIRRRAQAIWPHIRHLELWCVKKNDGDSLRHPSQGIGKDAPLIRYIPTGVYP